MIKRRRAIEPTIGHMKADGKHGRNWLTGALGDAIHAVLCGAGHNIRRLRRLRLFYALLRVLGMGRLTCPRDVQVPDGITVSSTGTINFNHTASN